jgi:hypothetical protein
MKISFLLCTIVLLLCSQDSRGQAFKLGLSPDEVYRAWKRPGDTSLIVDSLPFHDKNQKPTKKIYSMRFGPIRFAHVAGYLSVIFDEKKQRSEKIVWKRHSPDSIFASSRMWSVMDTLRSDCRYTDFRPVAFDISEYFGQGRQVEGENGQLPYYYFWYREEQDVVLAWEEDESLTFLIQRQKPTTK